jgi:hypothetical protein
MPLDEVMPLTLPLSPLRGARETSTDNRPSSLLHFITSSLHHFITSSLHHFITSSLHHFITSSPHHFFTH